MDPERAYTENHMSRQSCLPAADAIVVGAGPNGLAAAIVMAQAGCSVNLLELASSVGGGARTAALTLPGFRHDVCSSVHPLAAGSPFFLSLPLHKYGLEWIHPSAPLAHPLDDGSAVMVERSVEKTAALLGRDGPAYSQMAGPLARYWKELSADLLAPPHWPAHPLLMARFGLSGLRSARSFAAGKFTEEPARALFAGMAAHSMLPLDWAATASFGLVLMLSAHAIGWPFPKGGSQAISNALAACLEDLGGKIVLNHRVESLDDLPPARAILCDVTPRQLLAMASDRLPSWYRKRLARYRYGPAAFKVDWALNGPIPWSASECARAGTVHLGGTLAEIAAAESDVHSGKHPEKPFVLLAQPSLFDPTRAPQGQHTAWAYCHVPNGSSFNMAERIETQIERFAPGCRSRILARSGISPTEYELYNPNMIGGDINGGLQDLSQLFLRPTARMYSTPATGVYLCSSSTPPGGGVHGMCGYFAAQRALRDLSGPSGR
ncbi:MAG TPA: NAD(P)/FAD-dependent oxidoreductase [Terriglobales bacterium]